METRRDKVWWKGGKECLEVSGHANIQSYSAPVPKCMCVGTRAGSEVSGQCHSAPVPKLTWCNIGSLHVGLLHSCPQVHMWHVSLAHVHFGTGAEWFRILACPETSEQPFSPLYSSTSYAASDTGNTIDMGL